MSISTRLLAKAFLSIVLLFSSQVYAAVPGAIDLSFNSDDKGFGVGDHFGLSAVNVPYSIAVQDDGKIIVGGDFNTYNAITQYATTNIYGILRLNSDSTLDTTFNTGWGVNYAINSIIIQSDGKIVIVGAFSTVNGVVRNHIARLNSDGTLDSAFNSTVGANGEIFIVVLQSDGKILIGGNFNSYNGSAANRIARINSDGSLDSNFSSGSGTNGAIKSIAVQGDGKILIAGSFTSYNGVGRGNIARLGVDGTLDAGFDPGSGSNSIVSTVVVQNDGKILMGGDFTSYNGTITNRIARLNNDGSIDGGFNPGSGADSVVNNIVVLDDGSIVASGNFGTFNGAVKKKIARLYSDGSLVSNFNAGGGFDKNIRAMLAQDNGLILLAGDFTYFDNVAVNKISRIDSNGFIDAEFNGVTGANQQVRAIASQSDGKILIGGAFSIYNGVIANRIVRINSDGSVDQTFNVGTGGDSSVTAIAEQSDGKIIVGGDFRHFNGLAINRIVRLNADGSIDSSFNPGSGANDFIYSIVVQPDGKILIGGAFSGFNGIAKKYLVRLNSDGSDDGSFDPGTGPNSYLLSMALQSDGKILIGGTFSNYRGNAVNSIARVNSDGAYDTTFNSGNSGASSGSYVYGVSVQADGKIVIAGSISTYNGVSRKNIARLNANGSLDTLFTPGSGANGIVFAAAIQNDGMIIIGGMFTSYKGTPANHLARIDSNGSIDNSFLMGSACNGDVDAMAIQDDGRILIGGVFTGYNSIGRNRLARIHGKSSTGEMGQLSNFDGLNYTDDLVLTGADVQVWRTTANLVSNYQSLGTAPDSGAAALVATPDVNGDGVNDMVFQSPAGNIYTWIISNSGATATPNWLTTTASVVKGSGDFNKDGVADLVLQDDTSGDLSVIILQNGQISAYNWLGTFSSFRVKAVGDINGDGTDDIVMQDASTYDIAAVTMLNGNKTAAIWEERWPNRVVIGTGDVNGDGIDDIYTNKTGDLAVITMANTGNYSGGYWVGAFTNYTPYAIADVDGDGNADYVLQDTSGNVATVTLNSNVTVKLATWLGNWDYSVKGAIDTDGDLDADIVIQRTSDGAVGIIEMQNGVNVATRWIANTANSVQILPKTQ